MGRGLGRAMKWTILENRSTTVMMVLLPLEVGRPVTKSRAMSDHGRPGVGRGRRRPAGGRLGGLAAGADVAGSHELPCVCFQGGPPKALADDFRSPGVPGVAGQAAGVSPLPYLTANSRRNKEAVRWAPSRIRLGALGHPNR